MSPVLISGAMMGQLEGLRVTTTGADGAVLARLFGVGRQVAGSAAVDLRLRGNTLHLNVISTYLRAGGPMGGTP
ncbi:MAG: hypothetical protein O2782_02095, partial [bacterium]|nr:hypothetical protein [bacterium]